MQKRISNLAEVTEEVRPVAGNIGLEITDPDPEIILPFALLVNPALADRLEAALITHDIEDWYGDVVRFILRGD